MNRFRAETIKKRVITLKIMTEVREQFFAVEVAEDIDGPEIIEWAVVLSRSRNTI
jgi:hypothetical protein